MFLKLYTIFTSYYQIKNISGKSSKLCYYIYGLPFTDDNNAEGGLMKNKTKTILCRLAKIAIPLVIGATSNIISELTLKLFR